MKLTLEERKALAAIREPAYVYSKPLWLILKRLAGLGLCEVANSKEWQGLLPGKCPLGISVITSDGKRALREDYHRNPARSSRVENMEVANALS